MLYVYVYIYNFIFKIDQGIKEYITRSDHGFNSGVQKKRPGAAILSRLALQSLVRPRGDDSWFKRKNNMKSM